MHPERTGELVFVKLGGSVLTDKTGVDAARPRVIKRLAREIAEARDASAGLQLVLGHGSGSFGHTAARRFGTRSGVRSAEEWKGFAETAAAAQRLNSIVASALWDAGVPIWSLQPSASARCMDGELVVMAEQPVREALAHHLVPLVYGDVALDDVRGGTIVSTEEIFVWLARRLRPDRIVLVGDRPGVMPSTEVEGIGGQPISEITPQSLAGLENELGEARGADVTGGMLAKVRTMGSLVIEHPRIQVRLISGRVPGLLARVLCSPEAREGTLVRAY